jgi:hypothetical protein
MVDPVSQAIASRSLSPGAAHSPYYVVVPPYIRTSAGIRAMHLLVHWLNQLGYQAYIHLTNGLPASSTYGANPDLLTPVLTQDQIFRHYRDGRTPIVLCSETHPGTLFRAPFTVRWYGHNPGALAPDPAAARDLKFGYTARIAEAIGEPDNVLCLPVVNVDVFHPEPRRVRKGSCFYAAKYKEVHRAKVFGLPPGCIEITRDRPDSQTPAQIAELFRSCEYFYCFEESALMLEAALCECPVILMKNPFFLEPFGVKDFGWDGFAWCDEPSEVARAKATVHKVADNYGATLGHFFTQLERFITLTQRGVRAVEYPLPILLPELPGGLRAGVSVEGIFARLAELEHHLMLMHRSVSWRITAPMRAVTRALRRLLRPRTLLRPLRRKVILKPIEDEEDISRTIRPPMKADVAIRSDNSLRLLSDNETASV